MSGPMACSQPTRSDGMTSAWAVAANTPCPRVRHSGSAIAWSSTRGTLRRPMSPAFSTAMPGHRRLRSLDVDTSLNLPGREDPGGGGDPVEVHVVRLDGKSFHDLAVECECPAECIGTEPRQEPIVMPGAAAQPPAFPVERQSGDEHPVDGLRLDLPAVAERFWNPQGPRTEVSARVLDAVKPQASLRADDARTGHPLVRPQRMLQEPVGFNLFGECPGVEENRTGRGVSVKRWEQAG